MRETTFGLHEIFKCAYLKFTVYGRKQTYIHTTSANAVTLVWGSLRLTPINGVQLSFVYKLYTFLVLVDSLHFAKLLKFVPQHHHRLIPDNTIPEVIGRAANDLTLQY